jgi:large subunit ribosomal protein L20
MRVKKGETKRAKHKKLLAQAKGYRGARSKLVRTAKEAVLHAGEYAFAGRHQRKRDNRALWITKVGNILGEELSYSQFVSALKKKEIGLDRRMLAHLAEHDPDTFAKVVEAVKK